MLTRLKARYEDFWVTALVAVLFAAFFLLFGFAELFTPDIDKEDLSQYMRTERAEGIRICIGLIAMGFTLLVGVIIPYWGGILVGVCVVLLVVLARFHPAFLLLAIPVLLIGVRLFFEGRDLRKLNMVRMSPKR